MRAQTRPPRILVVDDEEHIRCVLRDILEARKYEVAVAPGGEEAVEMAIENPPDLIILDLAMPRMDGMEVCRQLRTWLSAPILILSVRQGPTDKVAALDLGADDYLVKPFIAAELLARVRALLRRVASSSTVDPVVKVGDLQVDLGRRRVVRDGEEIRLTRTEFEILAFLLRNADRVVTSRMILQTVWGPEYADDLHSLRVHIGNLRKKIEPDPAVPRYVVTEPGVGYCLFTA